MPTGNGARDNSLVAMLLVSNLHSVKRPAASLRCEPSGRRKAQLALILPNEHLSRRFQCSQVRQNGATRFLGCHSVGQELM